MSDTSKIIVLSGPFMTRTLRGEAIRVESLSIERTGYIPDVAVNIDWSSFFEKRPERGDKYLETEVIHRMELYDDNFFVAGVLARLKELGFEGPPFFRAELGMQSPKRVMLEPNEAFDSFAKSKGWVNLDEAKAASSSSKAKP